MKNALHIGQELCALLPVDQRPEYTEGYEGFFHLIAFNGAVEEADIAYIIRDHDRAKFEAKKELMADCVDFINTKYGAGTAVPSPYFWLMKSTAWPIMTFFASNFARSWSRMM